MRGRYFKGVVHGKKKKSQGCLNDSPISEVCFQRFSQTMTIGSSSDVPSKVFKVEVVRSKSIPHDMTSYLITR